MHIHGSVCFAVLIEAREWYVVHWISEKVTTKTLFVYNLVGNRDFIAMTTNILNGTALLESLVEKIDKKPMVAS
jgi:hypothetical protein